MKIIHLPLTVIAIGVLLVVASQVWPSLVGGSVWSEEQARTLSRASAEVHRLQDHGHGHGEAGHAHGDGHDHGQGHQEGPKTLEEAKRLYEIEEAKLRKARSFRSTPAVFFKWSGILCLIVGVVGFYVLRTAID